MKNYQLPLFPETSDRTLEPRSRHNSKKSHINGYVSSVWSFPDSEQEYLYRWYGTLPEPLIQQIISLYASNSNARILDPFMGLGTTLDISARLKLNALGIDVNPLSCLIAESRLFCNTSKQDMINKANQIANNLSPFTSDSKTKQISNIFLEDRYKYTRKWFRHDTLNATLKLLSQIADIEDMCIQRLLFVSAAQVIREVASVDPRCTHHLVTKQKPFIDPIPLFIKRVSQNSKELHKVHADPDVISVKQGSVLKFKYRRNMADLVLVHPPYLGFIHYHLIHRLATDLLDIVKREKSPTGLQNYNFDYETIKSMDVSTDNAEKYGLFIKQLAGIMYDVVSSNGRCIVIVGDQRHKQHLRHTFTQFIQQFEDRGFRLEENFIWILQNNGGMHVLRRGHFIDHNYILVFHKDE